MHPIKFIGFLSIQNCYKITIEQHNNNNEKKNNKTKSNTEQKKEEQNEKLVAHDAEYAYC